MGCCSCTNLKKSLWIDEEQNNNNENRININMDMNKEESPKNIKNYSIGNAIPFKPPELKCDNMEDNTKIDEYEEMLKKLKNNSKNKESESSINNSLQ